jgi:hypothetical protein
MSPPTRGEPPLHPEFHLPFGREVGPWIALLAGAGLVVSALARGKPRG